MAVALVLDEVEVAKKRAREIVSSIVG